MSFQRIGICSVVLMVTPFLISSPAMAQSNSSTAGVTHATTRDGQHDFDFDFGTALLTAPVGAFKDGRSELFNQDTFHGRSILVRGVWSDIAANSGTYKESYSDDVGKTWKAAFLGSLTRENQ